MPGDTTVLLAKTGRTISYKEMAEAFEIMRGSDSIVSIQRSRAVSTAWVLNTLAGMSFPNAGQAYDYMKKCLASSARAEKESFLHELLERIEVNKR